MNRFLHRLRRPAEPRGDVLHAPLLTAADIAGLAAQAAALVNPVRVREVHDHHAGDWASRWLGRGLDFEEARLYSPGDDIRDMDWRTTARTGRPHLKIYREERQPIWHLVIDRGQTMRFGTRRRLKVTQAARLATLLAFLAVERNGVVGATLWDAQDQTQPSGHGRLAALALAAAAAQPCPPMQDPPATEALHFHDRLAALDAALPRGARLVLVSDFSWLDATHEALLARLADRLDVLALCIVDPAERDLSDLGLVRFHYMEAAALRWLDTGSVQQRRACHAAFAARQAQLAACFGRAGVRHRVVGSEVDDLAQTFHK
jgi:uncharacterized protein (DUF58 family)